MSQNTKDLLSNSLNSHGFGFQYAVLNTARACFENKTSPWAFEVAEFPVFINGKTVHIDFILRNAKEPFFLIAECKRSDPALSDWCFVKTPLVSKNVTGTGNGERIVREVLYGNDNAFVHTDLEWIERTPDLYRLPFEVKADRKGEGIYGRGQLNDSVTQVLRGQNGLIDFFANEFVKNKRFPFGRYEHSVPSIAFMPVIFTTAKLWVSNIDLTKADLNTGNIEKSLIDLKEKKWLFYQYAQSPDLKHNHENTQIIDSLSDSLYQLYTRSIAIVTPEGIEDFFSSFHWREPKDWQKQQR